MTYNFKNRRGTKMMSLHFRKLHSVAITAAAIACLTASNNLVAANADTAPNITYTATGVFATPQIIGGDVFKLAGEPFSIKVVVNAGAVPTSRGTGWSKYTKLPLTGTIGTALSPS